MPTSSLQPPIPPTQPITFSTLELSLYINTSASDFTTELRGAYVYYTLLQQLHRAWRARPGDAVEAHLHPTLLMRM